MQFSQLKAHRWIGRWSLAAAAPVLILGLTVSGVSRPASTQGGTLYKAKCASCHGPDGSGQTQMGKMMKLRDLRSADVQSKSDAQLTEIIAKGKAPMPAYEKQLSKDQIGDVVAFIRELGKKQ